MRVEFSLNMQNNLGAWKKRSLEWTITRKFGMDDH